MADNLFESAPRGGVQPNMTRPSLRPNTVHGHLGTEMLVQLGMEDAPWTKALEAILGCQVDMDRDGVVPGLLEEWVLHFLQKQRDYGDHADDLGAPGQYAELHRKIGKLKKAMWDGTPLRGEPAREVCLDLIGHLFLAIKHMDENNYGGKPTK